MADEDKTQDEEAPRKEPDLVDWKQPYSTTEEPPTSTPANPPQPTGDQLTDPTKFPDEADEPATDEDDEDGS
jgi:hypothetical protein